MRKIINVRRNRNDTMMWFVVHDTDVARYEVWFVGPGTDGSKMEGPNREREFSYQNNERGQMRACREARNLARDLSDAA